MSILCARFLPLFLTLLLLTPVNAQRNLSGTPEIKLALDKLPVLGSVLMIAAHPDDENTALLAYYARGKKMRTAYLSLTRGEGGQNLIGPQQGAALGLIRTRSYSPRGASTAPSSISPARSISVFPRQPPKR